MAWPNTLRQRLFPGDLPAWRAFATAIGVLALAFLLALFSAAASEMGRFWLGVTAAVTALGMAAWVAIAIVPKLARRTNLRWLAYQMDYKLTRAGLFYLAAVAVLVLAAVNTGNNLLFLVLACLLAGILVSGVLSRLVLSGIEVDLDLPEQIFAGQAVQGRMRVTNEKLWVPSFSLLVEDGKSGGKSANFLAQPVYFPHIPAHTAAAQAVKLVFPRRGMWSHEGLAITTRFPFGFIKKTRHFNKRTEILVYPRVEPLEEFSEMLALAGDQMAGFHRGRGHELHSLRDYQHSDSARFVSWRASARTGALKVREFTRDDEQRVMIALDTAGPAPNAAKMEAEKETFADRFERAVSLAAGLACHFSGADGVVQLRTPGAATAMARASEIIHAILRDLALIQPEAGGSDPATSAGIPGNGDRGEGFLESLAAHPNVFKIILTGRAPFAVPPELWASSHVIFFDSL